MRIKVKHLRKIIRESLDAVDIDDVIDYNKHYDLLSDEEKKQLDKLIIGRNMWDQLDPEIIDSIKIKIGDQHRLYNALVSNYMNWYEFEGEDY